MEPLGRFTLTGSGSDSMEPLDRFRPAVLRSDSSSFSGGFTVPTTFFQRFHGSVVRAGSEPVANGSGSESGSKRFGTGSVPSNPPVAIPIYICVLRASIKPQHIVQNYMLRFLGGPQHMVDSSAAVLNRSIYNRPSAAITNAWGQNRSILWPKNRSK